MSIQNRGLQIGDLYARRPLVQGGMGIGISMSGLASAVARAGGIGVISAAQPGYREADFDRNPMQANLRALAAEIKKAKRMADGGIIAVNIMTASNGYAEYVRCCMENGADMIISGAGLPTELPALTEGNNIRLAPIVSPPKSAKVLLQYWHKHYGRIPDMLIIEGPMAGGHLGYTAEETAHFAALAEKNGGYGYDAEIREILSLVQCYESLYERHIPVVFGGGVFTREDIDHYMTLGCDGVQMATRFVVTEECDAANAYKEAYLAAREEDIQLVKSPVGMPGRAIRNAFIQQTEQRKQHITGCHHCLRKCKPAEIPYCITDALVNAARGRLEQALLFCGANAWRLTEMTTVPALMQELFPDDAEAAEKGES